MTIVVWDEVVANYLGDGDEFIVVLVHVAVREGCVHVLEGQAPWDSGCIQHVAVPSMKTRRPDSKQKKCIRLRKFKIMKF